MAKDTQANLGFEKQLWDAACVLWGSIPVLKYHQITIMVCDYTYTHLYNCNDYDILQ